MGVVMGSEAVVDEVFERLERIASVVVELEARVDALQLRGEVAAAAGEPVVKTPYRPVELDAASMVVPHEFDLAVSAEEDEAFAEVERRPSPAERVAIEHAEAEARSRGFEAGLAGEALSRRVVGEAPTTISEVALDLGRLTPWEEGWFQGASARRARRYEARRVAFEGEVEVDLESLDELGDRIVAAGRRRQEAREPELAARVAVLEAQVHALRRRAGMVHEEPVRFDRERDRRAGEVE
jgi:outer membrane murein-binding lipoprotein Lpp